MEATLRMALGVIGAMEATMVRGVRVVIGGCSEELRLWALLHADRCVLEL